MAIQIIAITKPVGDERYEAISHYWTCSNGSFEKHEREFFINWLIQRSSYAYVSEDGNVARCDIKDNGRIRYLQTRADASEKNNLLSLPRW